MTWYLGIDPGVDGALALVRDPDYRQPAPIAIDGNLFEVALSPAVVVFDMPTREIEVSGKPRRTIDAGKLAKKLDEIAMLYAPERAVMEEVGGIPGQSAPAAFSFGRGVGLVEMAAMLCKMNLEKVPSSVWKPALRAPKDKRVCVSFTQDLYPDMTDELYGPPDNRKRRKPLDGRAEAILIARWAALGYQRTRAVTAAKKSAKQARKKAS